MKTSIRSLTLFIFMTVSGFAGQPFESMIIIPNSTTPSITVPAGKLLTVITFTADGSTNAGGTRGTVTVVETSGGISAQSVVLRSYDPADLNDTPHTVTIAGIAEGASHNSIQVYFTGAQNVGSFVTYEITNQ